MSAVRMSDNERVALELFSASEGQRLLRREMRAILEEMSGEKLPFYKIEQLENNSELAVQVIDNYRRDIVERIKAKTWVSGQVRELNNIMDWCKLELYMVSVGAVVLRGKNQDSYEDKHFSLFTDIEAPRSYRGPRFMSLRVLLNRKFIKEVKELLTFAKEYQQAQWTVERQEREFERAKKNVEHHKDRVAKQELWLEKVLKREVDGVDMETYVENQMRMRKEVEEYINNAPHSVLHYTSPGFYYNEHVENLQNAKHDLERAKEDLEMNQKTIREFNPASVEHKIMALAMMKGEIYLEKHGLTLEEEE
tara:strand:- start:638 stop:1561 length:924 start_codon:yes stop_codon:yes gene_type:complete